MVIRNIGLLCGTFNPIHYGHLLIAECAREQFQLEKVLFITSGNPPHRHDDLLHKELRHKMVQAAIAGNTYFEAPRVELDRKGPSYTVDTLRELKRSYGQSTRLNLIVGADNVPYISQWHKADELLTLCRLLVAARPKPGKENIKSGQWPNHALTKATIEHINTPIISISSSEIRERLSHGRSILYMVPEAVKLILESQGCDLTQR